MEWLIFKVDRKELLPYEEGDRYEVQQVNTIGWIMGLIFIGIPVLLVVGIGYGIYRLFLCK